MSVVDDAPLLEQIGKLIHDVMENHGAIKGISIGTSLANNIYTKLKPDLNNYSENDLVAAATSLQYISRNLFEYLLKNKLSMTQVMVDDKVLILVLVKEISASMILDRKLAELEGISIFRQDLYDLALKISAFVETSDLIKEDPFVLIKRAVPSANMIAFITREGMPIKIEASNIQEALLGSMISAISNMVPLLLHKSLDYSILQGPGGLILIVQFDETKVLAICLPEMKEANVGSTLAKIKEISKICNPSTFTCDEHQA